MKRTITITLCLLSSLMIQAQNLIDLSHLASYKSGAFDEGAMEIVAYNPTAQVLYAVNGYTDHVDVFDISNPSNITKTDSIDITVYGDGANSVAYKSGYLAIAVEANDFDQNGHIVFFDSTLTFIASLEVGVLPDMVTFSADGMYVLSANEGEPDDDYTADPMGSVSIIDISGGVQNVSQGNVTTLDFTQFDANYDPAIRNFGPVADYMEDLENTADSLDNLIIVTTAGNIGWYYDDYSGDHYAEMNAFSASGPTTTWMITPAMNFTGQDSVYFSFENTRNFSGGSLEVLISTDFDPLTHTDPANANWDTITGNFAFSSGGYADTNSGRFSLENYLTPNVSIAFVYEGAPGAGNSSVWQIDDLMIEGTMPRLSQNLEPEYIALAPDNSKAFVVCQENNAMAIIDLASKSITSLKPLGFKDYSTGNNKMDASNRASSIDIRNWPVFGMYQPDAIKAFEVNGTTYIATANEGDSRDYDFYSEEERVKDLTLDATAFPNAANLQMEDSLGRLNITTTLGDTDGDGDFDELYSYGGRGFSIWDENMNLIWDSEDQFAQTLFSLYPNEFNSNNDDNSSLKSRSDDKASEPEAIEIAVINGFTIAFVGLERMGGIMVYDITDPSNPSFISYFLHRDFSVSADDINAGDLGPEDIKFIPAAQSPNGENLLAIANEVSGTLSLYSIGGTIGLNEEERALSLQAYPNPSNGLVQFSQVIEGGKLYNLNGQMVMNIEGNKADLSALPSGIYQLVSAQGKLQILKK